MGAERRNPPGRKVVSLFIGADGKMPFGCTRDFSPSGVFVVTEERPTVGAELLLTLVWGDDTYEAQGRVVRHGEDGVAFRFGAQPSAFVDAVRDILSAGDVEVRPGDL